MPSAFVVATELRAQAEAATVALKKVVATYSQLGLAKVRANASGRPGPRRVTGNYLRSMNVEIIDAFTRSIGTNAPQARRLENGFVGTDSLGRHYNQPPYPHWQPMADWLEPKFEAAVETIIDTEAS